MAVLCVSYLAGALFLVSLHQSPRTATPLTWPRYWVYQYDHPRTRTRLLLTLAASSLIGVGVVALILWPKARPLHGDARWATRREIRRAGLFAEQGLLLGKLGSRFLTLDGQQGAILIAPPRSGKGVGVVIPNLLNWPSSVICLDIKHENWALTAGYRARFTRTFLFDPLAIDGRTARWNPLHYVSDVPHRRIDDVQRIATMLCVEVPGADPFWVKSARSLFVGIALYLFERRDYERAYNADPSHRTPIVEVPVTIGEVLRQAMASDDEGFAAHWKRLIDGWQRLGRPLSPTCVSLIMDVVDLAPQTASSVRKTFTSQLDLWLNPLLDLATSANDFDLRQLRRDKISLYLGVKPRDFERLQPVLNLFFQQAIGEQTAVLPEHDPTLKHQLLILLDEFAAVGRLPILVNAIAFVPGYNVRTLLVIQTPAQLNEIYGAYASKILQKTVAARIVFAPNDHDDARQISEELGTQTVRARSRSRPSAFSAGQRTPSTTVTEQRRALLLPQEVRALGTDRELIFLENLRPIRCTKIRYYEDQRFTQRLLPAPPVPALDLATASLARAADPFAALATKSEVIQPRPRRRASTTSLGTKAPTPDTQTAEADFSLDFSGVDIPPARPMTPAELSRAVDRFLADLETELERVS